MASSSSSSSSSLYRWLVLLPVIGALLYNYLDANPTLFVYDKIATVTGGWQHASLKGKTIWITGASSGIGASLVCQAIESGAGHVIFSSRKRDKLEQVAKECQEASPSSLTQVSIVPYDAANEELVNATVDSALAFAGGNIDIMILCAGVYQLKPAMKTTKEERRWITKINYYAPVDLAESLLQRSNWKERGHGHIVVVASIMAHGPHSLSSTYAASKAALRNYFFTLSTEEFSWLRVDVACPGATQTGMWDQLEGKPQSGSAMMPQRVAHLLLTGVAGPRLLFYETWIANFISQEWMFHKHYTPGLFHGLVHWIGYVRVPVWEKEQMDALSLPLLLEKFVAIIKGKY